MRFLSLCLLLLMALSGTPALAQLDVSGITGPSLAIDLQPQYPQPGEEVVATLNDYAGGTYGSGVTWILNGQVIPEAENQRSTTFTAAKAGGSQELRVILTKPQGGQDVISTTISPVYIDIIIEPQTRTPRFYLGRSLPSIGSQVNATALVSTAEGILNPDLVYTWQINRKVIEAGPIRGRNQVSFATPMGDDAVLSLQVTRLDGTVLGRRSIAIPSVNPQIVFYEVNALYGMKQIAINNSLTLLGNTATIQAEPYNLDIRTYNKPDIKEWKVGGQSAGNVGGNPYEITLQRTGVSSSARVDFHVRDTAQILQGTRGSMNIQF